MMKSKGKMLMRALTGVDDCYVEEAAKFCTGRRMISLRPAVLAVSAAACAVAMFFLAQYTGIFKTATGQISTVSSETASESVPDYLDFSGSPIEEVDSMDEAAKITGFTMTAPQTVEPYSNSLISVRFGDTIAITYFDSDSSLGLEVIKASGSSDISGDYTDYKVTRTVTVAGKSVILRGNDNSWSVAAWTAGGFTYAVNAQNRPLTTDEISGLIEAVG